VRARLAWSLAPIFALTGFSALTLQVTWQRVVSLHSGVDLSSTTTVVAAFLGGLGLGNLLGGRLADRLGPSRSLVAFGAANVGIGVYAWVSLWLLYDLYRELAASLDGTLPSFLFNVAVLAVPTLLMGVSLPLVARAVTDRVSDAGPLVGRMYSVNTIGAAAGAAVAGWLLLGTYGFEATVRIAGTLNLLAAALILLVHRLLAGERTAETPTEAAPVTPVGDTAAGDPDTPEPDVAAATGTRRSRRVRTSGRVWPWFAVYALTGAVALGFEQVFFRLIDAEMRSNSYSFAHVLTLYLLLFGIGAAVGARLVRRARDSRRWFLWLQFAVGVSALLAMVVFVEVLPRLGLEDRLASYLSSEGYNGGFGEIESLGEWAKVLAVYVAVPLGIMGPPVLLMGASYPFVQALVSDRIETLGRRTGTLLFANTAGNVAGILLVGFVLIDSLGTAGTYRLLATLLGVAGVAAALLASRGGRVLAELAVVVVVLGGLLAASPSNHGLWAFLHGVDEDELALAENHACVSAIRYEDDRADMYVNASIQNGHPFDDFHVLIGLLPMLAQEDPERSLAIGLGIGATTYGMLQDPRVDEVETVELCEGQYDLLDRLAEEGRAELARLGDDPRHVASVGDGRTHLLSGDERYDVITVDTLRSQAAFSGSLYSKEFYELVDDRLADTGIVAQWVPTERVLNSVATVFPYVKTFRVDSYNFGSVFFMASRSPIGLEPSDLLARFDDMDEESFPPAQRAALETFVAQARSSAQCITDGERATGTPESAVNTDLRPRDEYFVNNDRAPVVVPGC
jgi:predicted membrane-bound spermidine synthase